MRGSGSGNYWCVLFGCIAPALRGGALLIAPALRGGALLAAVVCSGSCKKDSPANRYFHAAEDLQAAVCGCDTGDDMRGLCSSQVNFECQRKVVRAFEDEIGDFLDCATKHVVEQTRCARKVGCDPELLDQCLDNDIDDTCGELPEETGEAISHDIEACDDTLTCDDGSTAKGRICDGNSDCDDGSDEFCEPMTAGGTAGMGMAVATPPSSDGGRPVMAPATPTALQLCVNTTLSLGGDLVSPVCAECACIASPMQTLACDSLCWGLLMCVAQQCTDPDAGSSADLTCITRNCSMPIGGSNRATAFTGAIRSACTNACPMLF